MIPKEWEERTIDDIFFIKQGKQVSKKNRIGNNQRSFLRTANVFWGYLNLSELDQMNFTKNEEEILKLENNDILVCEGGEIGRTAIWQNQITNCYYQNHIHRLRKISDNISSVFFMFWMQYAFVFGKVYFGIGNKTTIPNLSRSRLGSLQIPLPPLPEQRKIAYILSTIQHAIETQEKLIGTTTELKKALMQKLFTEGLHGEAQKETEIGLIPESWDVVKLGDVCSQRKETDIPNPNGGRKYVGLEHISSGDFKLFKYGPESLVRSSKNVFIKEDLLYGKLRPYLDKAVIASFNGICSTDIIVVNINDIPPFFIIGLFHTKSFLDYAKLTTSGVNHPRTSWAKMSNYKFGFPSIEEQKQIAHILSTIDNKIELAERKKTGLQDLFKTMLHKLMTAEVRVHDKDVGEVE